MEKIISDMANPYWWISVILIGIILNVLAGFLKDHINKRINKFSEKRKEKFYKIFQEDSEEIDRLSKSDLYFIYKNFEDLRHRNFIVIFLVFVNMFSSVILFLKLYKKLEFISSMNATIFSIIMLIIISTLLLLIYFLMEGVAKKRTLIEKSISKIKK